LNNDRSIDVDIDSKVKKLIIFSGLPAVIVIITAAIAIEEYGDENL
jgi:hypothetical protein